MTTLANHPFVIPVLVIGLCATETCQLMADDLTTLHNFTGTVTREGANPTASLILSGDKLYGTTKWGGAYDSGTLGGNCCYGTVFVLNIDGTGFATLHHFSRVREGAEPLAGLVLSGNTLYGTASSGGLGFPGSAGSGTVFKINVDGTGFTTIHLFTPQGDTDGAVPVSGLVLAGNTLYGTAQYGGASYDGTIYSVNTDGTGFTNLYSFAARPYLTNGDGARPEAPLILSGHTLYGTTWAGGISGYGTIFSISTDGTDFRTLHSFTKIIPFPYHVGTNIDGAQPAAGLILSGNMLYGTSTHGGSSGYGTVFAIRTDGTSFRVLHTFTDSDGANPYGSLVLSGNTLYGTALNSLGTVFSVNTDGTHFTKLHSFTGSDGASPLAALILSDNMLYGTAGNGGSSGYGTVFKLATPRPPSIDCSTPLVLECTGGGAVGVVGVGLTDSSGNPVVVLWSVDGTPYQTNSLPPEAVLGSSNLTLTAVFGLGEHVVTVSASNGESSTANCSTTVQVRDTVSPQILGASAVPSVLWPPDHQMVPVTIEVKAIDDCGPATCKIVAVTSNDTSGSSAAEDWLITGDLTVDLRAERLAGGENRTYTIVIECDDVGGNTSFSSVVVTVPHGRGQPGR